MRGRIMDVHGAGAQRSDPKSGSGSAWHGPQGDAQRVDNYVRVVRGGGATLGAFAAVTDSSNYPGKITIAEDFERNDPGRAGMGTAFSENRNDMRQPFERRGWNSRSSHQDERQNTEVGIQSGGFVGRLDRDGDGKVSRSEFDGPEDRFDFHDENNDEFLTEEEAPKGPPGGRRPPRRN